MRRYILIERNDHIESGYISVWALGVFSSLGKAQEYAVAYAWDQVVRAGCKLVRIKPESIITHNSFFYNQLRILPLEVDPDLQDDQVVQHRIF